MLFMIMQQRKIWDFVLSTHTLPYDLYIFSSCEDSYNIFLFECQVGIEENQCDSRRIEIVRYQNLSKIKQS